MKYVLYYGSAPDVSEKAPAYGNAHRAHLKKQSFRDNIGLWIGVKRLLSA